MSSKGNRRRAKARRKMLMQTPEGRAILAQYGGKQPQQQARRKSTIIPGDGDPCPRCNRPTQIHEHAEIMKKMLRQPFYYSRWFRCTHSDCPTTLIMPPRFIVWNTNPRASHMRRNGWSPPSALGSHTSAEESARLRAIMEQLGEAPGADITTPNRGNP
jgi:hypothetical protein